VVCLKRNKIVGKWYKFTKIPGKEMTGTYDFYNSDKLTKVLFCCGCVYLLQSPALAKKGVVKTVLMSALGSAVSSTT
jgi:hypothetical protein